MKLKKQLWTLALAMTVGMSLNACAKKEAPKPAQQESSVKQEEPKEDKNELTDLQLIARENAMAVAWFQTSGEKDALFLQGYNLASMKLKEKIKETSDKPYSIVLDLDETVLDNGPYQAQNIKEGKEYDPKTWNEWCKAAQAKAVAGAKDFLNMANENNVEIYYISDRDEAVLDDTIKNLENEGIPVQARDRVMLKNKDDKSGKKNRREAVEAKSKLILLFGDNLSDFGEFSKKSVAERNNTVSEQAKEFGDRYIIFPNPMYGSFESSIYEGKKDLTPKQKMDMRLKSLHYWK
ncbi:MAG: 5'-nucleotidase, lipoprotein e(P4) family [Lachnospiraceae bacterium]|nr:5'-nucleotidase, lipoprotein e(P4) family [Lachnospiraceae bacterium]